MTTFYVEGGDLSGPVANADPNSNATDHVPNEHAQDRGLSVAGVAGDGPAAVIGAIQGFPNDVPGLKTALSHVPTPSTTTEAATPYAWETTLGL